MYFTLVGAGKQPAPWSHIAGKKEMLFMQMKSLMTSGVHFAVLDWRLLN